MMIIDNCLGKFGINGKRDETLFERAVNEEEVVLRFLCREIETSSKVRETDDK